MLLLSLIELEEIPLLTFNDPFPLSSEEIKNKE
jgi:hypothetical protein